MVQRHSQYLPEYEPMTASEAVEILRAECAALRSEVARIRRILGTDENDSLSLPDRVKVEFAAAKAMVREANERLARLTAERNAARKIVVNVHYERQRRVYGEKAPGCLCVICEAYHAPKTRASRSTTEGDLT
jgi:hypothetical protein